MGTKFRSINFYPHEIRSIRAAQGSLREIADAWGVSHNTIAKIRRRETYWWVGDAPWQDREPPQGFAASDDFSWE